MKHLRTLISVLVSLMLIFSFTGNLVFAENQTITLIETENDLCSGIALDSSDRIYYAEADSANPTYNLYRMDSDGQNNIMLADGLAEVADIDTDSSGNIYLAAGIDILKLDENGENTITLYTSSGPNIEALEIDSNGNIYFVENYTVNKMDPDGNNITVINDSNRSIGLFIDSSDMIYGADGSAAIGGSIYQMDINGTTITTLTSGFFPSDVAVDSFGYIYSYDRFNNIIKRMDADGQNLLELSTGLIAAFGLDLDSRGDLYVTDPGNNTVVKIICNAPDPVITTQPVSQTVELNEPVTLSVSAEVSQGILAYQWFSNDSETYDDATPIEGATDLEYTPATDVTGTRYYFCQITNSDVNLTPSIITSDIAWVTVNSPVITTPETIINETIDVINSLETRNYGKSLISKLENILAKIERSDETAAINQLNAFINAVEAQSGKKIDHETADYLINQANSVILLLEA